MGIVVRENYWKRGEKELWELGEEEIMGIWVRGNYGDSGERKLWNRGERN